MAHVSWKIKSLLLGLCLLPLSGCRGYSTQRPGALVTNPTYRAWEDFEPGTSATMTLRQREANSLREFQTREELLEVNVQELVLATTTGSNGQTAPLRRVEPRLIAPAHDVRTHPQAERFFLEDEQVVVEGRPLRCRVEQIRLRNVPEDADTDQPATYTVLRLWTHPDIPGQRVRLLMYEITGDDVVATQGELTSFDQAAVLDVDRPKE